MNGLIFLGVFIVLFVVLSDYSGGGPSDSYDTDYDYDDWGDNE